MLTRVCMCVYVCTCFCGWGGEWGGEREMKIKRWRNRARTNDRTIQAERIHFVG